MFNVAYGLGCDSHSDPTLIRMEKLMTAMNHISMPAQLLLVSLLLAYVHDKNSDLRLIHQFNRKYFQL
jgi:hypothetical protein